ncbi:MAG: hypothetical protein ABSA33_04775, partial [Candidatus Micrarchaeaceae archaeon]
IEKIASAISQLAHARQGVLQIAVGKLQSNFSGRLSKEHMHMAMEFLESTSKAAIFGGLQDGEFQDRWLERNSGVEVISAWGSNRVDEAV